MAAPDPPAPAWLYGSSPASAPVVPSRALAVHSPGDRLQSSRELGASRWSALKGGFESYNSEAGTARQKDMPTPVLAVFSLAGGVGKTSLVATLGRALSSLGEKVLLADTTSYGLLPYYFGATESKPGVVRTFSPPSGSSDAPILLISYDVDQRAEQSSRDALVDEMTKGAANAQRLLVDFNVGSGWLIRSFTRMAQTVLIPVAPDMNSVFSLSAIDRFFQGAVDYEGHPLRPYYVINQFDPSLALHRDVREVLARKLGDRLLPYVVRRSSALSEALAEGMTVVDYQPEGPISEDYMNLAKWLHGISAPGARAARAAARWSER